jgi:GxxExxY protein
MIEHHSVQLPDQIERIAATVVDAAFKVHKTLGPGLLESAYEHCLAHELKKRGLDIRRQVVRPIVYDDIELNEGYRIDMLVNGVIGLELKAVEAITPTHTAQLLTYLRLSGCRLGFLINFSTPMFKNGVRRLVV